MLWLVSMVFLSWQIVLAGFQGVASLLNDVVAGYKGVTTVRVLELVSRMYRLLLLISRVLLGYCLDVVAVN